MNIIRSIQNRIYKIRGERVMPDFDLADLYEVPTKALNQAVKRNIKRFLHDFMFRLTLDEWQGMRSQNVTAYENADALSSSIMIESQAKRNKTLRPTPLPSKALPCSAAFFIAIKPLI